MTREDKLALAGDYVLGLMNATERQEFERAAAADTDLAAMATRLADRMTALDETAVPVDYDAGLWGRIEQRLDQPVPSAADTIVAMPPARDKGLPRWLPLAASVVLALGIGYIAGATLEQADAPTVIAIMVNQTDGSPAVIVEAFADDSVHLVPLESFAAPEGQVLQVWTLPDVATGPVSLGTLNAARNTYLDGPSLPMPQDGQLYEITLEPAPGSPTGRPTGPILVKGFARAPVS